MVLRTAQFQMGSEIVLESQRLHYQAEITDIPAPIVFSKPAFSPIPLRDLAHARKGKPNGSRLRHLSDSQLLAYFNLHYP
jgi:hypothetical protein